MYSVIIKCTCTCRFLVTCMCSNVIVKMYAHYDYKAVFIHCILISYFICSLDSSLCLAHLPKLFTVCMNCLLAKKKIVTNLIADVMKVLHVY